MGITYEQLRPSRSKFQLGKQTYGLKPFTLAEQVIAHAEFRTEENKNGLEVLMTRLGDQTDFEAWTKLLYQLLDNSGKDEFETYDKFLKELNKWGNKKLILGAYNALSECIGNSQPEHEDLEADQELKKLNAPVKP